MSNPVVNRGTQPNDQQADTLYDAFGKVNDKFSEHDDLKQVQDATEKQTPVDDDKVALIDSEAQAEEPKLKWLSWANIKAILKAYFDTLYNNLGLGETETTAYRGDRGKTAYDHSQATHAPSTAQVNSDITKAEIEAKLTGSITTHTHNYESPLNTDQKRKITISTSNPSGGTDGDIWMQYE